MARAIGQVSALIVGPIFIVWMICIAVAGHQYLVDFSHSFLPAARAVAHGTSPYPSDARLHELVSAPTPIEAYLYPPLLALLEAPLILVPYPAAAVVYSILLAAALGGALWLMGVRDVRCYSVVCLWPATFTNFQTGAISIFIALGIALAWRWRTAQVRLGVMVAVLVALKLFVWPLGLWLLVARRYQAVLSSMIAFPMLVGGGWLVIGSAGLRSYPHLLDVLGKVEAPRGFGIGGIAAATGTPRTVVMALGMIVVGAIFARLAVAPPSDLDRTALSLAIFSMLLLSPIVWMHYLILLTVPTALASRGFSRLWVAPAVFQFAAVATMQGVYPNGNPVALGVCWASIAFTTFVACRTSERQPSLPSDSTASRHAIRPPR